MKSKQINKNNTSLVRIDTGLLQLLKVEAATRSMTIKTLLEGYIADGLDKDKKD